MVNKYIFYERNLMFSTNFMHHNQQFPTFEDEFGKSQGGLIKNIINIQIY